MISKTFQPHRQANKPTYGRRSFEAASGLRKAARVALPLLIAIVAVAGLGINASISYATTPHVQSGCLNLSEWDKKSAFEITGEWEFYWDRLLGDAWIESNAEPFTIVEAPGEWNYYNTEFGDLPGTGRATYRVRVTGAQAGTEYAVRVQNMASAYRLYVDGELIAQNGNVGDDADAPASAYRPQLNHFSPQSSGFDLILQVSNDAYAVGGMWEPIIFGTAGQVDGFDRTLSAVGIASYASLIVMCLSFLIFYTARRQERDMLILTGIGALVLLRLTISGDIIATHLLPDMPISGFGMIDYLTLLWIQFLLLYFFYCAYSGTVTKWQVIALLAYSAGVSLCVLLMPFEIITNAYTILNAILLIVIGLVTVQLARAAWRGQADAPALLGTLSLILLLIFYAMFFPDWSIGYYLLTGSAIEYMILFFVQCVIVARRYNHAQKVEISFLRGQINPHFIHNSLTGIASTARTDPDRTRELLLNVSRYLRGFYDYDSDDLISLKKELALVRAYANIEQMRFGTRVQIDYQIEADNLPLPPLILQPLVENAFVHGLREKEEGGIIVVYAKRVNRNRARIGVRDNGLGFGVAPSQPGRNGIGIENINRRLSQLYRTQLVFTVPDGGGCEVYFELPWKEVAIENESVLD